MVAKISIGSSLYGALAYNAEKINEGAGKLLAASKVFDDGNGKVDIAKAVESFHRYMPSNVRTRNTVIHISLNPHPDDRLTDVEMTELTHEYMEKLGYGEQPYMIFKHEDIDRHHVHIVSINVDEKGRRLNKDFLFRRSKDITRSLEQKYGLYPAERRKGQVVEKARKVDIQSGDIKRQVGNAVKALASGYRFQSFGEYRALLSLYNVCAEEIRGKAGGREYRGIVYSATDDNGDKVGNPFKSSLLGKSVGYAALERHFARSKEQISKGGYAGPTKRTVLDALGRTYHKDKFAALLKTGGIDMVLLETAGGCIYGATFIDHRTGCVLNGSQMGRELSANALQEHFTLPYEHEKPIPFTIPPDKAMPEQRIIADNDERPPVGLGLFTENNPSADAAEDAFERQLKRKKRRKKGLGR